MRAFLTEAQREAVQRIENESGNAAARFVAASFRLRNAMEPRSLDRESEARSEFKLAADRLADW